MGKSFTASLNELENAKDYVRKRLSNTSWKDSDWELSLEEAITNIINHAAADSFELSCNASVDQLKLALKDRGIHYDPDQNPGFGLLLMHSYMDEIYYQNQDGYNHLTMIKHKGK